MAPGEVGAIFLTSPTPVGREAGSSLQVINSSGLRGDVGHVGTPLGYFPQSISFINNVSLGGKATLCLSDFVLVGLSNAKREYGSEGKIEAINKYRGV